MQIGRIALEFQPPRTDYHGWRRRDLAFHENFGDWKGGRMGYTDPRD